MGKNKPTIKDNKVNDIEISEDVTQYGEFISSFDNWISPQDQKQRAKELENFTKQVKKRE